MSPILSTTPSFIMSPDLPVMPTSLMPTPTTQSITTHSVTVNHSQPHSTSALVYTIPAVSVIGLSIVIIFGWLYIRRRKTKNQEASVGLDNDKTRIWEPTEAVRSSTGKASDNISGKASDMAFTIGDDDSDKDSETGIEDQGNDHTKHHSEDSKGNAVIQDKDHPENPFYSPDNFDTSISSASDSDDIRNDASLSSEDDRASDDSHNSHVTDTKRISIVHWAAVKQAVADRTSIVQSSLRKVECAHSPHTSLEVQIVGHTEDLKDPEPLSTSTAKKVKVDNNLGIHGMDSILAEIDAIGELYSSDGTSSNRSSIQSEATPAVGSFDSAGARRVDHGATRHSAMEAIETTNHSTAIDSSVASKSARITHHYSSDFRLTTSTLSVHSDSSGDYVPLPLIRPLNIKKKPASSTPVPAVRSARGSGRPAQAFKFPNENELCQAVLKDSLVYLHDTPQKDLGVKIIPSLQATLSSYDDSDHRSTSLSIGDEFASSYCQEDSVSTQAVDTQSDIDPSPSASRSGTPNNCNSKSSSRLPSLVDDTSMASPTSSCSSSSASQFSYEDREREAIANWSTLLHSSPDPDRFDPFDSFCTYRHSRTALKGKGRSLDTPFIQRVFSRFPIDDGDTLDVSTCSFVFDALMDSVVVDFATHPSIDLTPVRGAVIPAPPAAPTEQHTLDSDASAADKQHAEATTLGHNVDHNIRSTSVTRGLSPEKEWKSSISAHVADGTQTTPQLESRLPPTRILRQDTKNSAHMPVTQGLLLQKKQKSPTTRSSTTRDTHQSSKSQVLASSTKVTPDARMSKALPSVVAIINPKMRSATVKQGNPPKSDRITPISSPSQSPSMSSLTRSRSSNHGVAQEPPLSKTSITPRLPPIIERRSHNKEETRSPEPKKQPPPRPGTLSRAASCPRSPVSAVKSLSSRSPTTALTSSPRPPSTSTATRPRSRTVVSLRESFGKTDSCARQTGVGYPASVGNGTALARQSLASARLSPGLTRVSGRQTERGVAHVLSTPNGNLGERQLSEIGSGPPGSRTQSGAHGLDSPQTKTLSNRTGSGLAARSPSLGFASSHSASLRISRDSLGQQKSRSSSLLSSPTRSSARSRSSFRTPLGSSTLHNVPRSGKPLKSKEPSDILHTISEDAQENTADLVDGKLVTTHRQKGSTQQSSSPPSIHGSALTPVRNTRTSGGLRGRSTSMAPPPMWH